MGLFGKKKEAVPPVPVSAPMPAASEAPAAGIPTDKIVQLRQQGLSNNQIIESLQREGYSSAQVFDAMSQADIKGIVETPSGEAPMPGAPVQGMPPPIPPLAVPICRS